MIHNKTKSVINKYHMSIFLFVILSVAASWSKITMGTFNDEEYITAIGLRLIRGDKFLIDCWDVHQSVAIFEMPFMWLYNSVSGNLDGIYVFIHIINTIVQLVLSVYLFYALRKKGGYDLIISAVSAIICFNFLPKWSQSFEYAQMMYIFLMASLITLYLAASVKDYLFGGILFALAILSYPTMILLWGVFIYAIYIVTKRKGNIIYFSVGCFIPLAFFIVTLFIEIPIEDIIRSAPYIFSDGHFLQFSKLFR